MDRRSCHPHELLPGDRVALAPTGGCGYFVVGGVDRAQGRVEVIDLDGGEHSYHERDVVTVMVPDWPTGAR